MLLIQTAGVVFLIGQRVIRRQNSLQPQKVTWLNFLNIAESRGRLKLTWMLVPHFLALGVLPSPRQCCAYETAKEELEIRIS
jgi:hypothetical protein